MPTDERQEEIDALRVVLKLLAVMGQPLPPGNHPHDFTLEHMKALHDLLARLEAAPAERTVLVDAYGSSPEQTVQEYAERTKQLAEALAWWKKCGDTPTKKATGLAR